MSVLSDAAPAASTVNGNDHATAEDRSNGATLAPTANSKTSLDTSTSTQNSVAAATDFSGDVDTNDHLPTQETLRRVGEFPVLDSEGRTIPFKSLYSGVNVARRVLVIFIRHFFCGNCQEYLRTLSASINTDSLLQVSVPTFIAVVGCGSPTLIPMYQEATQSPFPIYADPTRRLYEELGMVKTLALGSRPDYMRTSMLTGMVKSIMQGLGQLSTGKAMKGGDFGQVGGEFLFEPVGDINLSPATPSTSPFSNDGENKQLEQPVEEKRVTWCHRMRNTRDHAEIPELREVLGLDGLGAPGKNGKRWSRAVGVRKGTGFSSLGSVHGDTAPPENIANRNPPVIAEQGP